MTTMQDTLLASLEAINLSNPANQSHADQFTSVKDLAKGQTNRKRKAAAAFTKVCDLPVRASPELLTCFPGSPRRPLAEEDLEDGTGRPSNSFGAYTCGCHYAAHTAPAPPAPPRSSLPVPIIRPARPTRPALVSQETYEEQEPKKMTRAQQRNEAKKKARELKEFAEEEEKK
jgi:hypothetical protein